MVRLRKVKKSDFKLLDKIRGDKSQKLHESRLNFQNKGEANYYISFENNKPIGHVFVHLSGNSKHHRCPVIQDLQVKKDQRKKGLGLKIILEVEKKLKNLGYKKFGLDVETNEKWLIKFYKKIGFKRIGNIYRDDWKNKETGKIYRSKVYYLEKKII